MVNLEENPCSKQNSFKQVVETLLTSIYKQKLNTDSFQPTVETLLTSIYKQKVMLNYLALIEKRKLVQLVKSSTSSLDFKCMNQSVGDTLEKINSYKTLVNTKLSTSSALLHKPNNNNNHCCCNHCSNQINGKARSVNDYYGYWGRH